MLSSALSRGWSPCPIAVADPTDIPGVAVEEGLVSLGPHVVPAPADELKLDWFLEVDMISVGLVLTKVCLFGRVSES